MDGTEEKALGAKVSVRLRGIPLHLTIVALVLATSLQAPEPALGQDLVRDSAAIEILGLYSRSARDVEEQLRQFRPNLSLASAACAAVLRDSVGYGDAAVTTFPGSPDDRYERWVLISVVPPERLDLVQYRSSPERRYPNIERWSGAHKILQRSPRALSAFQKPAFLVGQSSSKRGTEASDAARRLRQRIRALDTDRDLQLARRSLLNDRNAENVVLGALVLANFADRDSVWHLLAEGLRRPPSYQRSTGPIAGVLWALSRSGEFEVNWAPARETLEALMGGTNLFMYRRVLQTLARTDIHPELGRQLARVNSELLLDHLTSDHGAAQTAARTFLSHISEKDFGRDRDAWQRWLLSAESAPRGIK